MKIFKSKILFLTLLLYLSMCTTKNVVEFELYGYNTASVFKIDAPENFEIKKYTDDHGYREYHYKYDDESILYITDDLKNGSDANEYKSIEYGDDIYLKIMLSDSIDIGGMFEGRYWREIKNEYVVYGYMNVPPDRKQMFDSVIVNQSLAH